MIILASSSAADGIKGTLPYHQEFDREVFAYQPPTSDRVTSFMLRLDTYSCEYRWLAEAKGVRWAAIGGGDTRSEGYVAPMSKPTGTPKPLTSRASTTPSRASSGPRG